MSDASKFSNQLRGQRVLIIGGTSGIGYAVAEACAENGMHVILASSQQKKLEASLASLAKSYPSAEAGKRLAGHTCDLSDEGTIESNIDALLSAASHNGASPLDHVIHSAGDSLAVHKIQDTSLAKIHAAGMVRFYSVLLVAKVLHKYMRKDGSFSFTTGAVSDRPSADWSVINGFATGMHGLARGLALDLKPVRVNCVNPGAVQTPLWDSLPEEKRHELFTAMQSRTLTGKIAQPEEVAETYLYIMKDTNLTGTTIRTDGGSTLI